MNLFLGLIALGFALLTYCPVKDGEFLDELDDGRKESVGDGLGGRGFLFQHFVKQQLQAVLEVGQHHAGASDFPSVVAQVATDELPEDWVQEEQALQKHLLAHILQQLLYLNDADRPMLLTVRSKVE
jgi:hypothetical protein